MMRLRAGNENLQRQALSKGGNVFQVKYVLQLCCILSANLLPLQAIVIIQKPPKLPTGFTQLDIPEGLSYHKL